jgi:prefoldin subunit 5
MSTRGETVIPTVPFYEDISKYYGASQGGGVVEEAIQKYREMAQKYKIYEESLDSKLARVLTKTTEIALNLQSLDVLQEVPEGEVLEADYELGDTMYARAVLNDPKKVHLWIGANTLCEFSLSEAREYLEKKQKEAQVMKELIERDVKLVKEQITTCEVTVARLYNHLVSLKRKP